MRLLPALALAAIMAAPSAAQEAANIPANAAAGDIIAALAGLIAGEEPCDLAYDQDAVAAYIKFAIAPNSSLFPSRFNGEVKRARADSDGMTESQRTAYCTQIDRMARELQFIE
ncbi:hypothetical protein [Devosia ginsengisoli]|uniref:hypothetical protein n=1 Tax=Devosia ginsengisoli TaxID=400770 RepID=UPI0026F14EB6|nr:hypothetical protein [Devosia ginsengisoli]MCR6673253.1 hypothetical protein [Devosia ginsengisoli]